MECGWWTRDEKQIREFNFDGWHRVAQPRQRIHLPALIESLPARLGVRVDSTTYSGVKGGHRIIWKNEGIDVCESWKKGRIQL